MKIWKSCRLGTTASSKRLTSPSGCNPARVTCWPTTLPGYPKQRLPGLSRHKWRRHAVRNWVTPEFMCRPRRTGFTGRIAGELQVLFYPVTDDVSDNGSYGSSLLAHLSHVGRGHFLPPSFRNTGWRSPTNIKVPVVPASFFGMVLGLAGLGT